MSKVDYIKMAPGQLLQELGTDASKWTEALIQHADAIKKVGSRDEINDFIHGWFANAIEQAKSAAFTASVEDATRDERALRYKVEARLNNAIIAIQDLVSVVESMKTDAPEGIDEDATDDNCFGAFGGSHIDVDGGFATICWPDLGSALKKARTYLESIKGSGA